MLHHKKKNIMNFIKSNFQSIRHFINDSPQFTINKEIISLQFIHNHLNDWIFIDNDD